MSLSDEVDGKVKIDATTASELAFGVGHYFREYCKITLENYRPTPRLSSAPELLLTRGTLCRQTLLPTGNMTIGWKRGGGSNLFIPKFWPVVGGA